MRPEEAPVANPEFPHDRLEPVNRPWGGKKDRAVQEEDLGKGGGRSFLPRRHPSIVKRAVSFAHLQVEIPDPDPGYGEAPGEKTERRKGDVDGTGGSDGQIRERVPDNHVVDGDV